jgi:PQQ-like domain
MLLMKKTVTRTLWRACCGAACAWNLLIPTLGLAAPLVSSERASRHGLERAWFAQVIVDAARGRVSHWTLHHDQLFSLSSSGTLQALNAETGESLWTVRIGAPDGVFAGPSVNEKFIAITSGTKLYVLDREDGHVLWARFLGSAGAAAPALSERYAFVGLLNGQIEGYPLEDFKQPIWRHQSFGRIFYSPTITGEVVCWPTDRGYLYVAQANQPRVLYRVETNDEIVAPPAEWEPYLYVASRDGYLYCLHELSGAELWRVATGYPVVTQPAAVAGNTYVASEEPALHAVDSETGHPLWSVVGATQFVAMGAEHVYGTDRFGGLLIIDKKSGGVIGRLVVGEGTRALVNDQSDRIYLVNDSGLVQCLRERDAEEPTYYRLQMGEKPAAEEETPEESPFVEEAPAEVFSPPEASEKPAADTGSPFQPKEKEEDSEDDNPFF